jgi:hypothetical protein
LVADAALGLVYNLCKGRLLGFICTAAGVISFYYPKPWTFPSVIIAGGLVSLAYKWYKKEVVKAREGMRMRGKAPERGRQVWGGRSDGRERRAAQRSAALCRARRCAGLGAGRLPLRESGPARRASAALGPGHRPPRHASALAQVVRGEEEGVERLGFNKLGGAALIVVWLLILVLTSVFAGSTDYESNKLLHWWAVFYRTGSVIFGGGQVRCCLLLLLLLCLLLLLLFRLLLLLLLDLRGVLKTAAAPARGHQPRPPQGRLPPPPRPPPQRSLSPRRPCTHALWPPCLCLPTRPRWCSRCCTTRSSTRRAPSATTGRASRSRCASTRPTAG